MNTCPECGERFDPANRANALTNDGAETQIIYCSVTCKRRAGNRRYYQRHRRERIEAAQENRRKQKE